MGGTQADGRNPWTPRRARSFLAYGGNAERTARGQRKRGTAATLGGLGRFMTPTLVRQHLPHAGPTSRVDPCARARDWAEIQERMLVPLYEAVYERLEVGPSTRLLGL